MPENDSLQTKRILDWRVQELLATSTPCVLLTILQTQGSVARKPGSRAIFSAEGLEGSVGGGLFEARICEEAQMCLQAKESKFFKYEGSDDAGRGKRLALCEFLDPSLKSLFYLSSQAIKEGERGAWVLDLTNLAVLKRSLFLASEPLVLPTDFEDLIDQELVSLEATRLAILLQKTGGRAKYLREGRKNLYVEPLKIQPCLLIIGAGTVALETAKLAAHCGFSVDIVDDRQDFATHERFPMAHKVLNLPNLHGLLANCEITPLHYVVIMTHSQELDLMALSQILASHAAYIGLLGGSSKRQAIFAALRNEGVPQPELACVHAPIGLNIGAETPEEIAVAVVAELLAAKTDMLAQVKS